MAELKYEPSSKLTSGLSRCVSVDLSHMVFHAFGALGIFWQGKFSDIFVKQSFQTYLSKKIVRNEKLGKNLLYDIFACDGDMITYYLTVLNCRSQPILYGKRTLAG